ncbi:hypothetical protein ACEXQE_10925 [Herbiconiux sp. P17]|uniref:hypothetical protein n=1 Tax=Herbiconiux wuyangfengii TaxID=3342794 RepID=UPI0035B7242E
MSVGEEAPRSFDVRDFARTAVGSHRDSIDLAAFAEHPLDPGTVRILAYMRELERSTMTYLRNVLVTPTHKDARVTAFLTTWAFEKYWIADAFEVIVRAHGFDPVGIQDLPRLRAFALEVAERATPIVEAFRANAIGPDVIGVHLASVTVDEWITEAAYRRLAELDPHPVLVRLLETVLTVKERHRSFVEPEAERRLSGSARARSLARRALRRTSWPIGASSLRASETAFFYETLFDDALADRIDARVQELPGLTGLHLIRSARRGAGANSTVSTTLGRRLGRTVSLLRHPKNPTTGTTSTDTEQKGGAQG